MLTLRTLPRRRFSGLPTGGWCSLLALLSMAGCTSHQPPAPSPATVTQPRKEAELTTVQLNPEALKRYGF